MRAELANYRTSPSLGPADRSNPLESTTSRRQAALRECAVGRVGGSSRGHRAACPGRDAASAGWLSASDNHRGGGGYYVGSSFDTIPHPGLLRLVAGRVSDGAILGLIKRFLRAPIVEEKDGKRMVKPNRSGVPQGGSLSPLLANLYLNGLDHGVNNQRSLGATLVRYADDMVLLCFPSRGAEMHQRLKCYLERRGLKLNEAKTRVLDANRESFRFLGFEIRMKVSPRTGGSFPHVEPSRKAQQALRDAVRNETAYYQRWRSCTETVTRVNRIVRGWSNYFHYGNCSNAFYRTQRWVQQRFRIWLWKKYDKTLGRYEFFTDDRLHGQYQLWKMPTTVVWNR
jgi:RNA-directed DNA polymerase